MIWVDSRVIRSVGHFALPGNILTVLEIEQRGKGYRDILQFYGAPQELAQELTEAPSKAKVFYTKIMDCYPCQKATWNNAIFTAPEFRKGERLPAAQMLMLPKSNTTVWGWDSAPVAFTPGLDEDDW